MGKASRDKGANYERELVRDAKAAGLTAYRTAALQAGRVPGAADITIEVSDYLHIEAKRDERMSVDAMVRQADAEAANGRVPRTPIVVYRRSNQPSRAVVPWAWLLAVLAEREQA